MRSLVKNARILVRGLTEPQERSTNNSLQNYSPVQNMLQHCTRPILKPFRFDPQVQVRVGLRPQGNENVWLELAARSQIIPYYGHGWLGVTSASKKWLR